MSGPAHVLRVSEHADVSVADWLGPAQRDRFQDAASAWAEAARLPAPPIEFTGPRGDRLRTRQYVGVIEAEGVSVEIYPKLDAQLLNDPSHLRGNVRNAVMYSLLWMMEVSGALESSEADSAHLLSLNWNFYDIFAYLMVKHLARELRMGVPHSYVRQEDDSPAVRGRIQFQRQVGLNWNRMDRVACAWDEYTADIPLNRVFKSACLLLWERVQNPLVQQHLQECLTLLEEVESVTPRQALGEVQNFRWDRSNERLRQCFEIAEQVLRGAGYTLSSGDRNTFVFLIDMNQLFEAYCARVVAAARGVLVTEQPTLGTLFVQPNKIRQIPDLQWIENGALWIADVKYKHLAKGSPHSLSFERLLDHEENENLRADQVLSPQDIRQVLVYAEIHRHKNSKLPVHDVAILYPFVGQGIFQSTQARGFNQVNFHLIPVRVRQTNELPSLLPTLTLGQGEQPTPQPERR